jgi:hypothetical protein
MHHASYHSMDNPIDDATLTRWSDPAHPSHPSHPSANPHSLSSSSYRSSPDDRDPLLLLPDAVGPFLPGDATSKKRRRAFDTLALPAPGEEDSGARRTRDEDEESTASTNAGSVRGSAAKRKAVGPKRKAVPARKGATTTRRGAAAAASSAGTTTGRVIEISEDGESVDGEEREAVPGAFGTPWK